MWHSRRSSERTNMSENLDTNDIVPDCATTSGPNTRGIALDSAYRSQVQPVIHSPVLIARDASFNLPTNSKYTSTEYRLDSHVDSGFDSFRSAGDRFQSTGDSGIAYTRLCNTTATESLSSKTISSDVENRSIRQHQEQWSPHESMYYGYKPLVEPSADQPLAYVDITEKIARLSVAEKKCVKEEEHFQSTHNVVGSSEVNFWYEAFQQDEDGDTILHLAIIHGFEKVINNLIIKAPHPAFLNLQNNLNQTPLHLAVLVGMPKIVRTLVVNGAILDIRDRRGNTALHLACQKGDLACAEELIRPVSFQEMNPSRPLQNLGEAWETYGRTQNLDLRNYEGQMCVHLATFCKNTEIFILLHSFGADINAQEGKSGRTALHFAVEMQEYYLMEVIAEKCCADVNIQTFAGLVPIHLAYLRRNDDFVDRLRRLGAKDFGPPLLSDYESDSSSEDIMITDKSECDFLINGEPLSLL